MNRFKAEEARKRQKARAGKNTSEIEAIDREDRLKAEIASLARKIHIDKFPEEYDFYNDSIACAADRRRGINPISADHVAKVAEKRRNEGVTPLAPNGMPQSDDTWEIAYSEAEARLNNKSGS
ncbi:hypothetical protein [Marinobacter maritimus]|uniref:hypothetical protein n=1 Tax=Marinobacter maritimus TaxID=277961 RepID=UPI0011A015CD|nr:hypothetical protein [Marinobacter maritimus]